VYKLFVTLCARDVLQAESKEMKRQRAERSPRKKATGQNKCAKVGLKSNTLGENAAHLRIKDCFAVFPRLT